MKLNLLAGAALVALATATGAFAQEAEGWYGAVDLGYNTKSDYDARNAPVAQGTGLSPTYVFKTSTEDDWAGFARLGYRYSPKWRVEFEGGYRPGDVDSVRGTPGIGMTPGLTGVTGSFDQTTFITNLIYDFIPESKFHPFVGVGIGLDRVKADYSGKAATYNANFKITGEDTVAAYQALAGFAWALSDRLNLDLTYRYLTTEEVNLKYNVAATTTYTPNFFGPANNGFSGKFNNQTVTVGLRWALGTPTPPPAPVVDTPP
ncbi:outer membrane protein, partial [Asticcacaulis sp. YBE204]|uniref:outer membrane protein n=1 Tax=Asticcacaulis sp. YBE204 TaxID=1282363 RepID=UPI0003C40B00